MKQVKKKKLSKQWLSVIILLGVFVILLGSYFIVDAVLNRETGDPSKPEKPEIFEGEALYLNSPLAYPRLEESEILSILVSNKNGTFDLTRWPAEDGSFWLGYDDGGGIQKMVQYIPPIVDAEGGFDYETLYAIENNDGYGRIYLLTYLCTAIGTPYYTERIPLPTGSDEESLLERELMLEEYGLDKENAQRVAFAYAKRDSEGKVTEEGTHAVLIGKKAITGTGYYYRVEGRDCIYYTTREYFSYALKGFYSFIKGMLVAAGLPSDSTYEPYLTTDFKEWVREKHEEEGEAVLAGSEVVIEGVSATPINKGKDYVPGEGEEKGYSYTEKSFLTFDLADLKSHSDFERIKNVIENLKVGVDYTLTPDGKITLTLISDFVDSDSKIIDFEKADKREFSVTLTSLDSITLSGAVITEEGTKVGNSTVVAVSGSYTEKGGTATALNGVTLNLNDHMLPKEAKESLSLASVGEFDEAITFTVTLSEIDYTYEITEIESLLDGDGEVFAAGTSVGEYDLVKVVYNYKIDGMAANSIPCHAVIDLEDGNLPASVVADIREMKVGELSVPYEFTLTYTERNSNFLRETLVIHDVTGIYDPDGAMIDTVQEDSYIKLRYYETVNGKKGELKTLTIGIKESAESAKWSVLAKILVGKKLGEEIDTAIFSSNRYYEVMRHFVSYELYEVDCFITSNLVVSFRFANPSDRDPFFGESFYENTLQNEYKLYGLNASACENVVKFLGGVAENSTASSGLSGETVALGLTHENMEKYGLYAYTIYFELPRGVYDADEGGDVEDTDGDVESILDGLSNYGWYSTLGFTLYISEEQPDGTRYVGSDMYDLIAKIDGENFYFLERSFVDFFARRNLMLMDLKEINRVEIDFSMEDMYGEFGYDFIKRPVYIVNTGNGYQVTSTKPGKDAVYTTTTQYLIAGSTTQDSMETEMKKYLEEKGLFDKDKESDRVVGLNVLYDHVLNGGEELPLVGTTDSVGVSNFKKAFELLQMTRYQGILTEEEQKEALATERVMRIRVRIDGSSMYYTYDFYRFDDRKVMVSLYKTDEAGNLADGLRVSDFYITTYAFKKLAGNFLGVANGVEITPDQGYPDYYEE